MASIHSMPRAAGSANKNSNCKRITINLSESCYGRCWNGTHVFISPAHCHSDSVFMITSIKHTQFLICFLISLNKSLVFPHKKIRRKQSQKGWKDEKWKREGKRGRRLDEGEVERETVLLLTAWDFSFLQKLKANIYPFFFFCVSKTSAFSVCNQVSLASAQPILEATSSPTQQTPGGPVLENFQDAGIYPKTHPNPVRRSTIEGSIHCHVNPPANFQPKELCLGTATEFVSQPMLSAVPLPQPGADSTALKNKCEQNLIFCWINLNCKSIVEFCIVL